LFVAIALQIEGVRSKVDKFKTIYAHLLPNMSLRNQQADRNVLRVALRGGSTYAVDVTSIQNGFDEKVLPWAQYMSQRSTTGKEVCTWPMLIQYLAVQTHLVERSY
jgi:hypothetical protein